MVAMTNPTASPEVRDKRQKGWSWFNDVLIDHYAKIVGPAAIVVYMALVRHADATTQECFPSYRNLAGKLAMSQRTIIRAINTLQTFGLISIKRRASTAGDSDSNLYTLLHPWGAFPMTLPQEGSNPGQTVSPEEVVTPGKQGASHMALRVLPPGKQGSVTRKAEQYSYNNTQFEQDSLNQKTPPTPSEGEESVSSSPKHSSKPKSRQSNALIDYSHYPGFLRLWDIAIARQGNKGSKKEALTAWIALRPNPEQDMGLQDQIINAYATLKNTPAWRREGGKYVKELHRWLDKQCWDGVEIEPQADEDARLIAYIQQRQAEESQWESKSAKH